MESIPGIINELGLPTILVIVGLFFLGIAFIDLSRSEGKLQFKIREKYPWPLAIIAGVLIVAGMVILFTPLNPAASIIQANLDAATATLASLETQIAGAQSREITATVNIAALQTQVAAAQESNRAAESTLTVLKSQLAASTGEQAIATLQATLQAAQTREANALSTVNAQRTQLAAGPKVVTQIVTATPLPTPRPPEILSDFLDNAFLTTEGLLKKPSDPVSLSQMFLITAKLRILNEIDTLQSLFIRIEEPHWRVEILSTKKDEGIEVYTLTAKHSISFVGYYRCSSGENERQDSFLLEYDPGEIRAEIQEVSGVKQVRIYSVTLDENARQRISARIQELCQ